MGVIGSGVRGFEAHRFVCMARPATGKASQNARIEKKGKYILIVVRHVDTRVGAVQPQGLAGVSISTRWLCQETGLRRSL